MKSIIAGIAMLLATPAIAGNVIGEPQSPFLVDVPLLVMKSESSFTTSVVSIPRISDGIAFACFKKPGKQQMQCIYILEDGGAVLIGITVARDVALHGSE